MSFLLKDLDANAFIGSSIGDYDPCLLVNTSLKFSTVIVICDWTWMTLSTHLTKKNKSLVSGFNIHLDTVDLVGYLHKYHWKANYNLSMWLRNQDIIESLMDFVLFGHLAQSNHIKSIAIENVIRWASKCNQRMNKTNNHKIMYWSSPI